MRSGIAGQDRAKRSAWYGLALVPRSSLCLGWHDTGDFVLTYEPFFSCTCFLFDIEELFFLDVLMRSGPRVSDHIMNI